MQNCSVTRDLQIVRGSIEDYKQLAHFHYRDSRPGGFTAVFAIRPSRNIRGSFGTEAVGVITYSMPIPGVEMRNAAMGGVFCGLDNSTQAALANRNIRCINRLIIEPRFRGLGLATRLVRETMPKLGVAVIEAMAVMGAVNPCFERAGMKAYAGKKPLRSVRLIEALSMVGVEKEELIHAEDVQEKLERLGRAESEFIEPVIRRFLDAYGEKRDMPGGLERTRFVLGKLTNRPVYYIWFNPEIAFSV